MKEDRDGRAWPRRRRRSLTGCTPAFRHSSPRRGLGVLGGVLIGIGATLLVVAFSFLVLGRCPMCEWMMGRPMRDGMMRDGMMDDRRMDEGRLKPGLQRPFAHQSRPVTP